MSSDRETVVRTDIQGLRALAVTLVLVYHLWPGRLPGGFVGVDAFFVISGFLITGHLLAHPPRTARDLATFWSRRVRRLLPASLLVLAVTLLASRAVAPETQWEATARQARAAALYVVNWTLARDSVDYLAAANDPSPVQHFWSLSVEEQCYAVWPVLLLLLYAVARRTRSAPHAVVGAGLGLVVASSLAYSVVDTARDPAAAYFVTPTRVWELGVGGLLAVAAASRASPVLPRVPSLVLSWVGLALLVWSAAAWSARTPFPGWRALVPVLATAAVLAAAPATDRLSPGPLLALRPVQWLGDVSYSVYLWHWPLLVLLPDVSGGRLGALDRVAVVVATLVLAGLTTTFVEDRFRRPRPAVPLRRPFAWAGAGMAAVVGAASVQVVEVDHREDRARVAAARADVVGDPCLGAAALDPGRRCRPRAYDRILPAPLAAASDKSDAYGEVSGRRDCWSYTPDFPPVRCAFGASGARVRVALVGNSHAGEWLPALQVLARDHGWRVDTYLASQCASARTDQTFANPAWTRACRAWTARTTRDVVASGADVVVMTNRISVPAAGLRGTASRAAYERGYAATLRAWSRAGLRVLVLHDTPAPLVQIPSCVAERREDYRACDGPRRRWVSEDPAREAVARVSDDRVRFVDLNDHICGPRRCGAVTGGVITYFDGSHLTATFARTLAPYLGRPLRRLLGAAAG